MRRCALLAALMVGACLVGACAGSEALDARMKPLVGTNEPALLAAMGRAPDASSEPAPGTKLLQWRWQRTYAIPDRMLGYSYEADPAHAGRHGARRVPGRMDRHAGRRHAIPVSGQRLLRCGDGACGAVELFHRVT